MVRIIVANFYVFVIVAFICVVRGLDLKKWSSWLLALYGFVSGFLMGCLGGDDSGRLQLLVNWKLSLQMGAIFAVAVMYAGAMNRRHRKLFGDISSDEK